MKWWIFSFFVGILLLPTYAYAWHTPEIDIQSLNGSVSFSFPSANTTAGVSVALADLGNDGTSELIIGNGLGQEPRVHVLRQDGSEIGSFLAYAPTLGVGINVTACDLTGDGYNEIVVAPQRGGGPHIRVFNRLGDAIDDGGFFAYAESMRTGVNLVCADLVGDARAELVTLPEAGGGPHVRVWNFNDHAELIENFFAFHADDRSGLVGAINNKKLFLTQQHTSTPVLKELVIHSYVETKNEQQLSIDGLGVASMFVHHNDLLLSVDGSNTLYNQSAQTASSLEMHNAQLATDGDDVVIAPGRQRFSEMTDEKRIEVDVTQQRLSAFSNGILENSFLISSGLNNATPLGNHSVLGKIPLVHYAWSYGEGDPRNYDLGWIPYNLRFYPHIYIHYAPWHNNFGHKMSHGCVNVNLTNIQWLYAWAQEGIPVDVHE